LKKLLLKSVIILLLLINLKAYGQHFVLRGLLKDSLSNELLAYATIHNLTLKTGTQTDEQGLFKLDVQFGLNQIRISHVGCDPKYFKTYVTRNVDTVIYMAHHQHELDDILIIAEKIKLIALEKDKLSEEDILSSGSKPIASILDKLSGVSSLKTGFTISKPVIQGMYGSRVVVLNNGIKQEGQQWGQEHGLEIDPYNTAQITLVKGAEALRYSGDAIGGILLMEPKAFDNSDTLKIGLSLAGTDNGRQGNLSSFVEKLWPSKRFGKVGFRVQGTLKRAGNLNTPDYYLTNTGFAEQNASLAFQLVKTNTQTFELFSSLYHNKPAILATSHIGNLTDLQKLIEGKTEPEEGSFSYVINRPYQTINHILNKARWKWQVKPTLVLEGIYGFQINKRSEFDNHNYFGNTDASLSFSLKTHQLDLVASKTLKKGWFFKFGMNGFLQTNNYSGRYFIPNYIKKELYQFSILRYRKNRHELELGYRLGGIQLDVYRWKGSEILHDFVNYRGVSWHAGWLYKLNHDWQLMLNAGNVWRNPNISELYSSGLHHGSAAIEYGDINLKSEHALSTNLVVKYKHNKTLFEAEAFIKTIDNYIFLNPKLPAELTIRGAFPAFNYMQTNALFVGSEIYLEQTIYKKFSLQEKVSLLYAKDISNNQFLNGITPNRFEHGLAYKFTKAVLGNGSFRISILQVNEQKNYNESSDYSPPPKGYFLLNSALNFRLSKQKNILIFVTGDNLLNRRYRSYLNRFRYYADETGRMLSVGLNIKF
jgi:iron complex outermembrane receptor protein